MSPQSKFCEQEVWDVLFGPFHHVTENRLGHRAYKPRHMLICLHFSVLCRWTTFFCYALLANWLSLISVSLH